MLTLIYKCIFSFYFYRWVYARLSEALLQNVPPLQKLTCTHPQTHVKATSEALPQTGEVDQSITCLLQQSNKVIIRQRLADLERPGQSKPAVMWGLLLAHVTVTESDNSCCQGMGGWRPWRWASEAEFKRRKVKKGVCGRNNRISANYPSSALYLHLHFNVWRARDANKIIHHYFIKNPDRIWLTEISVQFSHFHILHSPDIKNTIPPTVPFIATGLRNYIKLNSVIADFKTENTFISLLYCG